MDILDNLHTMSIAELRKYLTDNNVTEKAESKEELLSQVSQVIQTNIMIQEMMTEDLVNEDRMNENPMNESSSTDSVNNQQERKVDLRTLERQAQDEEYQEACLSDYAFTPPKENISLNNQNFTK